jgi:hypothetical protein
MNYQCEFAMIIDVEGGTCYNTGILYVRQAAIYHNSIGPPAKVFDLKIIACIEVVGNGATNKSRRLYIYVYS